MAHIGRLLMPRLAGTELVLQLALLAAITLILTGLSVIASWRTHEEARRIAVVSRSAEFLLRANENAQLERGLVQTALLAANPAAPATIEGIAARRAAARSALMQALDGLSDASVAGLGPRLVRVRELHAAHEERREAAGRALQQARAERPEALVRDWYPKATELLAAIQEAWNHVSTAGSAVDPVLARTNETAYLAVELREEAGRERAGLGAVVAGTARATPERQLEWSVLRGTIAFAWRRVVDLNASDPAMAEALAAVRERFFERYVPARDRVLASARAGEQPSATPADWRTISDPAMQSLLGVRDAALAIGARHLEARSAAAEADLIAKSAIALGALALCVVTFVRARARLLTPLRGISASLGALADGQLEGEVRGAARRDEIGEMARACLALQQSLRRSREMEREKEARQADDLTRAAAVEKAAEAVERVVAAARAGRFDERAEIAPGLGKLVDIVEGVNAICATTQTFLAALEDTADAMAHGDLTAAMPTSFAGQFAAVARNINEAVAQLAGSIEEAKSAASQTADAASHIRAVAEDFAKRAGAQAATIEQVSDSIEEFGSSVRSASDHAGELDRSAKIAFEQANRGAELAGDALAAMGHIETTSKRVVEIAAVINSIAFQTNLLALNASVEAARAGEQGRGFAVVAQEVRRLAAQASEAAQSVRSVVTESEAQITSGSERVRSAAGSLSQIAEAVREVSGIVSQIAQTSTEQATTVTEIGRAMQALDEATQQNAAAAAQNVSAADGLRDSASGLAASMARFETASHEAQARDRAA